MIVWVFSRDFGDFFKNLAKIFQKSTVASQLLSGISMLVHDLSVGIRFWIVE